MKICGIQKVDVCETVLEDYKEEILVTISKDYKGKIPSVFDLPIKKEFTINELIAYSDASGGYLTCDMVDWAMSIIDNKENDNDKLSNTLYKLLRDVFQRASPMWRDSHIYLRDKYGFL